MMTQKIKGIRPDPRNPAKWQARLRDPRTGKQKDYSFDSPEEALSAKTHVHNAAKAIRGGLMVIPANVVDVLRWIVTRGREGFSNGCATIPDTINGLADEYLATRKQKVESGKLSHKSYESDDYQLGLFKTFCKDHRTTALAQALSPLNLTAYKDWVEGHFKSTASQNHSVRTIKTLCDWAYENHKIDSPPRNLKTFRRVQIAPPKPEAFTKEEIHALLSHATPRAKLFILLALNCGYTQEDISTLSRSMVDFQKGYIDRSRHKVEWRANVPQKSKLWPITLSLLTKLAHPQGETLLLTHDGNPLVWQRFNEKGKISSSDAVKETHDRLRDKTGIRKTFKQFRKTGASLIKHHYRPQDGKHRTKTNKELFDLYLAHKLPRVTQAYDVGDWLELFDATDWLYTHLELDKLE